MTVDIRLADPHDGVEVSRVHASTVDRWWRPMPNGERVGAALEELSVKDRFLNGGPWMAPEPCERHLTYLLAGGQWPMVAVDPSGRIAGEIEVIVGPDPAWGLTAHIDVLAVDRDLQRTGVGSALVAEARRRAIAAHAAMLSTNPEDTAIGFYRRCGLTRVLARQTEVGFSTRAGQGDAAEPVSPSEIREFSDLPGQDLILGRVQTSYATWIKGPWSFPGLTDRLTREEGSIAEGRIHYRIRQSPLRPESAYATAWADRAVGAPKALRSLLRRAMELGFDTLDTTVDVGDLAQCAGIASRVGVETMLLGAPLIGRGDM